MSARSTRQRAMIFRRSKPDGCTDRRTDRRADRVELGLLPLSALPRSRLVDSGLLNSASTVSGGTGVLVPKRKRRSNTTSATMLRNRVRESSAATRQRAMVWGDGYGRREAKESSPFGSGGRGTITCTQSRTARSVKLATVSAQHKAEGAVRGHM